MRTLAFQPHIAEHPPQLWPLVFRDAGKPTFRVTNRRAKLDSLKSGIGELLKGPRKILRDHRADRICLTPDRQAKGIGVKVRSSLREHAGYAGARGGTLQKISSRNTKHSLLLIHEFAFTETTPDRLLRP